MPTLETQNQKRKWRNWPLDRCIAARPLLFLVVFFVAETALIFFCVSAFAQADRPIVQEAGTEGYLSEKYFEAKAIFDQGDCIKALQECGDEIRRTVQSGRRNWVDSICYHAMVGECHYQMGENTNALACFDVALQDYLRNSDCFLWLQWKTSAPLQLKAKTLPPWGEGTVQGKIAIIPDCVDVEYMIPNGDTNEFQPVPDSVLRPIAPAEVAACLALTLSRRAELLGPLGRYDELNEKLTQQLRKKPFPSDHWSTVWGDLLLAMALVTAGNDIEAKPLLEQGLQIENEADHPLTGFAQLELGKIALRVEDYPAAEQYFYEASLSGWHNANTFLLGEAFRKLAVSQSMTVSISHAGVMTRGLEWAEKERMRGLQVLLHILMADDFALKRDLRSAETHLKRVRSLSEQHDLEHGRLSGNRDYLAAVVAYHTNDTVTGDKLLEAATARLRRTSPWSFQLTRLQELFDSGKISISGLISPRLASDLYGQLLREPTTFDWRTRTAETFAVSTLPHDDAYEQWFALTVAQRDYRGAFEVTELTRRNRFQATLHMGHRLISIRYLIEAPEHFLQRDHLLQRLNLLNERPELKQVSGDIKRVREQIATQPLVAPDSATHRKLDLAYRELETLAGRQEAILHQMALEGIRTPNLFPPFVTFEEFRSRLPEGTLLLMHFETMGEMYGFLISRDKCEIWRINNPQQLKTNVSNYLAVIGQAGAASQIEIAELTRGDWTKVGQSLFLELLGSDRTLDFKELVIVPDGFLWYLPFETLCVDLGGKRRPLAALADRTMRYAPTAALGLPIAENVKTETETLVLLGKMAGATDLSATRDALTRMSSQVNGLKSITPAQVTRSPALYAKFIPQLVVWNEISPPEYDHDWAPLSGSKEIPGTQFSHWLRLPWGGPKLVILPGYHTAAEEALRNGGDGRELFVPLTALQSCGTETIIISRWQPGGRSGYDQVGAFLEKVKEAQHTPSQAWQKASMQVAASKLVASEEPRIKGTVAQKAAVDAKASHPFFWGGSSFLRPWP